MSASELKPGDKVIWEHPSRYKCECKIVCGPDEHGNYVVLREPDGYEYYLIVDGKELHPIPADPPQPEAIRATAERIAESLFVNGFGDRADRLVLTVDKPQKRDLGGLGFGPTIDRIEAGLREYAGRVVQDEQEWVEKVRPSVRAFALAMEATLHKHSAKKGNQNGANGRSGWRQDDVPDLLDHAADELRELTEAIQGCSHSKFIAGEAVDLANMAMMVWDATLMESDAVDPDDWDARKRILPTPPASEDHVDANTETFTKARDRATQLMRDSERERIEAADIEADADRAPQPGEPWRLADPHPNAVGPVVQRDDEPAAFSWCDDTAQMSKLLRRVVENGMIIASTNDLSELEIAHASANGRMYVDENGYGFAAVPKPVSDDTAARIEQLRGRRMHLRPIPGGWQLHWNDGRRVSQRNTFASFDAALDDALADAEQEGGTP